MSQIWELSNSHFKPKKKKQKQKKLIKFTLNLMLLQVPTHLVQVMWMKWIEWNFFEFHPSTTIYNGAPHLITYDYNSWPKQWSINKDQNSNVFWTEIVKSIHFCIQWCIPNHFIIFHDFVQTCHKSQRAITRWDEMSCLFWNVGHKYDELLCFGLLAMTMSSACFGLLAMSMMN